MSTSRSDTLSAAAILPRMSPSMPPPSERAICAFRRRRLKNSDFCAAVVPVRTIDQLRRMKSWIEERIHHDA